MGLEQPVVGLLSEIKRQQSFTFWINYSFKLFFRAFTKWFVWAEARSQAMLCSPNICHPLALSVFHALLRALQPIFPTYCSE